MSSGKDARRRRRGVALLAVGALSSALFLWLVLRDADLGGVWRALRQASLLDVVLAAVVIQGIYLAQAARWRSLATGFGLPLRRFHALVLGGIGANNVLPLRIGDVLRARWLATSAGAPTGQAIGSVFRDRSCDVVALVVALAISLTLVGDAAFAGRIAIAGAVLVVLIALLVAGALLYTRSHPRARRAARSRARRLVRDAIDELASPLGRSRLLVALAWSAVAWAIWACAAALVCRSVGISLDPGELVFVTAVINLGVVIPSSPGFVGTYQWLGVAALGVVGVDGDVAIAFSLLMQAVWFVPTTVVGGLLAVRELHREATRPRAESGSPLPSPP